MRRGHWKGGIVRRKEGRREGGMRGGFGFEAVERRGKERKRGVYV